MRATLSDFAIGFGSLFVLNLLMQMVGGEAVMPLVWQDIAFPLGAAAIFATYRHMARTTRS